MKFDDFPPDFANRETERRREKERERVGNVLALKMYFLNYFVLLRYRHRLAKIFDTRYA